jgi:hypothetical protein
MTLTKILITLVALAVCLAACSSRVDRSELSEPEISNCPADGQYDSVIQIMVITENRLCSAQRASAFLRLQLPLGIPDLPKSVNLTSDTVSLDASLRVGDTLKFNLPWYGISEGDSITANISASDDIFTGRATGDMFLVWIPDETTFCTSEDRDKRRLTGELFFKNIGRIFFWDGNQRLEYSEVTSAYGGIR